MSETIRSFARLSSVFREQRKDVRIAPKKSDDNQSYRQSRRARLARITTKQNASMTLVHVSHVSREITHNMELNESVYSDLLAEKRSPSPLRNTAQTNNSQCSPTHQFKTREFPRRTKDLFRIHLGSKALSNFIRSPIAPPVGSGWIGPIHAASLLPLPYRAASHLPRCQARPSDRPSQ